MIENTKDKPEKVFHTKLNNLDLPDIVSQISTHKLTPKTDINSKLWKFFIENDGTMTICLQNFFRDNLEINLLSSKRIPRKDNLISLLEKISPVGKNFENCDFVIERNVEFKNSKGVFMRGLSFWNEKIYNEIMKDMEDRPIGLVMKLKEIEYFRKLVYFIYENLIIKLSSYNINKQLAFILFEFIEPKPFEEFFGKFE